MANSAEQSTSKVFKKEEKKETKHDYTYKKREGASSILGYLYETKLLSLIYFKILHDDDIEEFYFATNVDGIGMFDDICLRVKLKGFDRSMNMFIQARYHNKDSRLLRLTSKRDLFNCFKCYLNVKSRFHPNNKDALFKGRFCETDCVFIKYTTAKFNVNSKPCEVSLDTCLNNHNGTGNSGSQPLYTDEDMDLLYQQVLEEQLITLAQKIAEYMLDDKNDAKGQIMGDELVLRYHYILAQKVFNISEIQPDGLRIASFREDFFCQSDELLQIFKNALYLEIFKRRKSIIEFRYRNKMVPQWYKKQLARIDLYKKGVKEDAVKLALKECKLPLEFKVPATFGNRDLVIRGNDVKLDRRLDYVCDKLANLIETTKRNNIVTIDESLDSYGLLKLIASAVGNIFVFDDTFKLFKFCEHSESLENIAKRFFEKLQSKIQNMYDYKFEIRGQMFPKFSLDRSEYDDDLKVKDFFNNFVLHTRQCDLDDVEKKIKDAININCQAQFPNEKIRSDAIYLKYCDEIQKWRMIPNKGWYLTKESELYKNAVDCSRW